MKTIADIIVTHGGLDHLKDEAISIRPGPKSAFMRLCIEYIGTGPRGLDMISVAHYYEQNGDLMRDPEMLMELPPQGWESGKDWGPVSFRMDGLPINRESCFKNEAGETMIRPIWLKDQKSFMRTWNKNIREQGYIQMFKDQLQKGGA